MADFNDIVKVAVDGYTGNVEKYSVSDSQEVLRQALIDINGGDKLDYKKMRNGANNGMFELIETIITKAAQGGLDENDFFMSQVDYRNVALGDQEVFQIDDDSELFYVAEVARGTQGIRRQRIGDVKEIKIPTVAKAVKIYEELDRVLAGRVDFNHLIDKVIKSLQQQRLNDIYNVWAGITATELGGAYYRAAAGSYSESALLDLIEHVEAAAGGKTATIVGTKKALRNLQNSMNSIDAANDIYHVGYMGSFYGSPVVALPQRHQINSTNFVLPDDMITVIAADAKPVKLVDEGEALIIAGNPLDNGDLTQEYAVIERYGTGIILPSNAGIGRYYI